MHLDNHPVFYIHLYKILCSQLGDIQLKSYRKYNILKGKIKMLHWKVRFTHHVILQLYFGVIIITMTI